MTNKEAIKVIKHLYEANPIEAEEALDLAIKALKQIDLIKFNIHALNKLIGETENENQG